MSFSVLSRPFKGITFRLTLIYSLFFGIILFLFAFILNRQFFKSSQASFDGAILNYAIDLSEVMITKNDLPSRPTTSGNNLKKHRPFSEGQTYFNLRTKRGEILRSNTRIQIPFDKTPAKNPAHTYHFHSFKDGDKNYRAVNLNITDPTGKGIIFQLAAPSTKVDELEKKIQLTSLILILLLILISSILSYLIANRTLNPIKVITATVNNMAVKNLSLRLPEFSSNDEFNELSITFNNLLERLQKSFEAQEHFVANASHQLNTPLAIIKGELDVLESKPRSIEEHRKFNRSLKEEVERMIELVKNLLLIARIEAGQEDSFRMRPLRLDDVLINTISRMRPRARDRNINIRLNMQDDVEIDDLVIDGERQLLGSMFENLLDNSIKYSPVGSIVTFDVAKNGGVIVSLRDQGPGIKPNELKNILEKRFRRGAMSLMPGTGIGLSIVYKIAEHHRASVSYEKLRPQGSLFTVHFAKQNF